MVSQKPPSAGDDRFLEGKLLIAMPGMSDPRFEKTVIFMCAHSGDGAMGLIVNKPVTGLGFREMMEKLELDIDNGAPDLPVLYGGPVQTGRGFVLHSSDYDSLDRLNHGDHRRDFSDCNAGHPQGHGPRTRARESDVRARLRGLGTGSD